VRLEKEDDHCYSLATDGAFSKDDEYLPLPSLDASAVIQLFRRLLLLRLRQAERLSESFMPNLMPWVHSGFSVYAGPPVQASEIASQKSQARYITRPVLAMDALKKHATIGPRNKPTSSISKGDETILLVEDESIVRELAAKMLKRINYNILYASNGDEALEIAQNYSGVIHRMITDVMMLLEKTRRQIE
jgi:hypothetical protein